MLIPLPAAAQTGTGWLTVFAAILLAAVSGIHLVGCLLLKKALTLPTKPLLMPSVILLHVSLCGSAHPFVIIALVCGCIGDIMLMLYTRKRVCFVLGMLSFLLGHAAYLAAAVHAGWFGEALCSHSGVLLLVCLAVVLAAGDVGIYSFLRRGIPKKLNVPCAVYIAALSIMAFSMIFCCAAGFAPAKALSAFGGIMFMVSDFVLACHIFGFNKRRGMNFIVMVTYITAQSCLALGFALS